MSEDVTPPAAPAVIFAADVEALLAEYEHDFIGKAHEIVQGLKSLIANAKAA
jgi:hypothetical protein